MKCNHPLTKILAAAVLLCSIGTGLAASSAGTARTTNADGGVAYPADFTYSVAIGPESGVTRRDPSDVIKVGDKYYVWYSKVTKGPGGFQYPSGYSADVWYASSPDGHKWTEQGEAIGKGGKGAWDEHGVFTPNILRFGGKYYLYYTAVAAGHNNSTPTHIGVAVAEAVRVCVMVDVLVKVLVTVTDEVTVEVGLAVTVWLGADKSTGGTSARLTVLAVPPAKFFVSVAAVGESSVNVPV